ncbi:MAG TPA: VanZ family protein [Gracilimonas sp.]|uniref:VanZ family protein n=1 Tax=Gracilimonas sp. TaxID=1974203 RepID=UPI002D81DE27|nr:VanZ family protein [Gracilimonas sp.]
MTKIVNTLLTRSVKLYFTLLILSTAAILYGTLFPADYKMPRSLLGIDKVVHFVMFAAWTFFYGLVRFLKDKFSLLPVFLVGVFFGLTVEVLQHLLPIDRSPELLDLIADISGTGFAIFLLYVMAKKVPQFKNSSSS